MQRTRRAIHAPDRFGFDDKDRDDDPGSLDSSSDDEPDEQDDPEVDSEPEFDGHQPVDQNADWHRVNRSNDVRPNEVPEFLGVHGIDPDIRLPEDIEEDMHFFMKMFLTDDMFHKITK